jgi:hypothetical protein
MLQCLHIGLLLFLATGPTPKINSDPLYSRAATAIWERMWVNESTAQPVVIVSPDGRSRATATHIPTENAEEVEIELSGAIGSWRGSIGAGVGSELLWSPDSRALFITSSEAGLTGMYHLFVIDRFGGELERRELTDLVQAAFGHPVKCPSPEYSNVAGITWVPGSHRLWAVAEVVDHSYCDSSGMFRAYEVDPRSMTILRSLDQTQAKRELHGKLSKSLAAAPDKCIHRPESCYAPWNHPELNPPR